MVLIANKKVKFILGARSANKLVFEERIKKIIGEENLYITTDDGSKGKKGFVTDTLRELIKKEKIDKVLQIQCKKTVYSWVSICK